MEALGVVVFNQTHAAENALGPWYLMEANVRSLLSALSYPVGAHHRPDEQETIDLIIRMSKENRLGGAERMGYPFRFPGSASRHRTADPSSQASTALQRRRECRRVSGVDWASSSISEGGVSDGR